MLDGFKSEPILPDKSITASMVTHGMLNASGDVLAHFGSPASGQSLIFIAAAILASALLVVWIVEARLNRTRAGAGENIMV